MRGSEHDRNVREFTIDHDGLHIHGPLHQVTGVLWGTPTYSTSWWSHPGTEPAEAEPRPAAEHEA